MSETGMSPDQVQILYLKEKEERDRAARMTEAQFKAKAARGLDEDGYMSREGFISNFTIKTKDGKVFKGKTKIESGIVYIKEQGTIMGKKITPVHIDDITDIR